MSWRMQPPVSSPVSAKSLACAMIGAAGLLPRARAIAADSLRERYGATDVLLTDSGISALTLALCELVPLGGIVAYPAFGCIDLTTAALGAGVRVRLYDLDPTTLSPDLDSVRRVIERGVDAIVVTHLYGYPADVLAIKSLAVAAGIPVIEDAAQGAGGMLEGRPLGSLADVSILSFGRGKGMSTGSGGALLVRTSSFPGWCAAASRDLGRPSRGAREFCTMAAQEALSHPLVYGLPAAMPALRLGEMVFHSPQAPRPISAASAAALSSVLERADANTAQRIKRARNLLSRVAGAPYVVPVRPVGGGESGYLRLAVLDTGGRLEERRDLGAVRSYPLTLDQHTQLKNVLLPGERAGSESAFLRRTLFTLPTHSRVGSTDLDKLEEWLGCSRRVWESLSPALPRIL
jgi:perosamine synthetase